MTPSRCLRRIFRAALAAVMTCSWTLQAVAQSVEDEATRAVEYTSQIERSLMAIEDGRRHLARDRWDPQYVVDTVGIDPAALFAFVRDEISWIPYRGTLRGPTGALMDRQANALDASLLLADLLTRAGYRARLARAQLPPETLDTIWALFAENAAAPLTPDMTTAAAQETGTNESVAPADAPPAPIAEPVEAPTETSLSELPSGDTSGSMFGDLGGESGSLFETTITAEPVAASPEEVAALYELDKAAAVQTLSEASANRAAVATELDRRTIGQGTRLLQMFAPSEDGVQQAFEQARAKDALGDHWWVQVEENGAWTDYDPLGPGGEPGEVWTSAEELIERDRIPGELAHRVQLRVVAEQLIDGSLVENVVFDHVMLPAEVIGKPISLRHLPLLWPSEWAAVTPDDVQEKLFAALYTQSEWMPALTVGEEAFQQSSILDTGAVNANPQPQSNPFLQITFPAAGKVGRVADLFDQLLEETSTPEDLAANALPGDEPRANGELTAEWLEYTVFVPGEEPKVTRREVFDIVGPAVRLGGDLSGFRLDQDKRLARAGGQMTETEIVILPAWPAAEFLADMTAELAIANKPLLSEFTRDPFGKAPPNSIELFSKMSGLPAAAYLYSMLRSQVGATQGLVFIDRPQVVAQHGVLTRVGPGEMTAKAALDVIENGVGVDPFAADQFVIRVLQGVADTNAEALALGHGGENVGEAFEKAVNEPVWTVFFPEDRYLIGTLGLPPDILARLLADLNAGQVIVSPTGDARPFELAGWWRVDPLTGTTLGMGNNGWGAVLVEYAFVLVIKVMLAQIACMAYTAAAEEKIRGLTAEQGREKVKTWAKNCVSQALLETVAGLSIGWIHSRFIDGAKVPTWNKRANPKSSGPKGTPTGSGPKGTPTGSGPKGTPTGSGPKGTPTGSGPKGDPTGGGARGDPTGGQRSRPDAGTRRQHDPCRADAGFVRLAALSPSRETIRDFEAPEDFLLAQGAGCGRGRTQPTEFELGHRNPRPEQFPEAVQATRQHTEDYIAAKHREVDAARRYHAERTYENRQAYKDASEAADAAHMREVNHYNQVGGRGHPPGTFQAPQVPRAPPGWEPLPPPPGEPALGSRRYDPPPAPPSRPSGPPSGSANQPGGGQGKPAPQRIEPMEGQFKPPPPPAPPPPRPSDARLAESISHYSQEHANANRELTEAVIRANANPTPENLLAHEKATYAFEAAKRAEAAAWYRIGGENYPPMGRPDALPQPPAPTWKPAPATGPNNTLAMGLGSLAGTIQKGP
jgi:hypothetical protein